MSKNPFDFVNSINFTKVDLMDEDPANEKSYLPFMVNTALSYFPDTVEFANQMNVNYHLDSRLQYKYLINKVRPRKRFSKWAKKVDDENLEAVAKFFGYNTRNAKEAMRLLKPEQIETIKKTIEGGGAK